MKQLETNEQQLNEFLERCKLDKDFIKIATFKNSVIVYFDKAIYSDLYEELKKLSNRVMIYTNVNVNFVKPELCLFIYKNLNYEID